MAKKSLAEIEKLRKQVSPTTFLQELAEAGYLYEYVTSFLSDDFLNDEKFRTEIFALLFQYSEEVVEELDVYFLEELNKMLENFIQKINTK